MIQSHQSLIQQLNRKIILLDEYASTLEKENLAKNNETSMLYAQLNDIRNENDILRSHLSRINQENLQRMRREQSMAVIEKKNHSINSSMELQPVAQQHLQETHRFHSQQTAIGCQTQTSYPQLPNPSIHHQCTQQITQLLQTTQQKDLTINELTRESQEMYQTIVQLEEENEQLRRQYIEVETKFKAQGKQVRSYEREIEELRREWSEERESVEMERKEWQASSVVEGQVERLVRQNNRLIEKVRMLQKEKNTLYAEVRGKNVSPLKTSQLSSRQNLPSHTNNNNRTTKHSFTGIPYVSSDQKPQPQRFSSQFGIGKQKEKLKADRWRKIEDKISKVKEENEQLRANLVIS